MFMIIVQHLTTLSTEIFVDGNVFSTGSCNDSSVYRYFNLTPHVLLMCYGKGIERRDYRRSNLF